MKTKRNITTALTVLMCISMLTSASAQSSKMPTDPIGGQPPAGSKPSVEDLEPFYRGGLDDQIGEAPNGAKANAQYVKNLSEGAFGGTQVVKVREGVWSVIGYNLNNFTFVEGKTGLIAFDTGANIGQGQAVLKMIQDKGEQAGCGHHLLPFPLHRRSQSLCGKQPGQKD